MRSNILAPLAVLALAATSASTASAQQAPQQTPPPSSGASASGSASASATFSTTGVSTPRVASSDDPTKTVLPWVLGGLGVAQVITGIVLIAVAPDTPDNCSVTTRTCTRKPGESDASFQDDQSTAGQSRQFPALGGIAIASGALFLVTGAAMYFWYKPSEKKSASTKPIVTPYASPNGGGLAAFARF